MKKLTALAATLLVLAATPSQAAAATAAVARFDFNEVDTSHPDSISGLTAVSGTEVINTGDRITLPYVADWKTSYRPQRLTRVANGGVLNPLAGDYAVEVRYRTTRSWGNLIQKGQNGTRGGYFKIELPAGNVTCLFKDNAGVQRAVTSPLKYNNGQFHVIRCERSATAGITLYIDGVRVARNTNRTGHIENSVDLSIGGKASCTNQPGQTSCDYFVGDIDYVQLERQV